jgi:hypothetical protein
VYVPATTGWIGSVWTRQRPPTYFDNSIRRIHGSQGNASEPAAWPQVVHALSITAGMEDRIPWRTAKEMANAVVATIWR